MQFIMLHAQDIITAILAVISAASAIANITPTQADNKIVALISKAVNYLALNFKK